MEAVLFEDETDTASRVAAMLDHVEDYAARQRLIKLDHMLSSMAQKGYEIGTPRKVRQPTKHTYAEWHIPITRNGNRCALSFFVNEVVVTTDEKHRKSKGH